MADFRKWFMVLAVVLLAAATASAQVVCTQAAQPTVMRQGGITEYIGEVDLNCTNEGLGSETAQFVLSLNTTVTNALVSKALNTTGAGAAIQVPTGIESVVPGIVYGTNGNTNNALRFPNVILPAGSTFIVRFVNVRADTSNLFPPIIPSVSGNEVVAFLSANLASGQSVSFTNQTTTGLVVGFVQSPVQFTVTNCDGSSGSANIALSQCLSASVGDTATTFGVTFKENQTSVFKTETDENGLSLTGGTTTVCDGSACTVPTVSSGVQLIASWTIPTALIGKIHIWVSDIQTATNSTTLAAELVNVPTGATAEVACGGGTWYELPDASTETAAWAITTSDLGNLDSITFGWSVSYTAGALPTSASLGVTLTGGLGPLSSVVAPVVLSASAPVVRFNTTSLQNSLASIVVNPCVTTLLFPYVTNVVGYDTGIAIANTSADPFSTPPQSGVCTLSLYGSSAAQDIAGDGTAPSVTTSATMAAAVASGQVFADTLENIFGLEKKSGLTTLSGYVIATCNFQFAHGYAYIVSPSGQPQGYLALVLGGSATTRSSARGSYERLDQ
jgi:hypothetical protein